MPAYTFKYNEKLGIELPVLSADWEEYSTEQQEQVMHRWEMIRGKIPDRIKQLEQTIMKKQAALNEEEDFDCSCRLNSEISELASRINDLQIWYRF
jgi:hypothetical protein